MNAAELGILLAKISVIDNRQIGDITILEWLPHVADVDLDIACAAVDLFRHERRGWIEPFDVTERVARIRAAIAGPGEDDFGNRLEPDAAAVWAIGRIERPRWADGREISS